MSTISQRKALELKRALRALVQSVENEKRLDPFSLNVREALAYARHVLGDKP